jgi:hypothetical protein
MVMKKTEVTTEYTLDGHGLVELLVNDLAIPNGIRGTLQVNMPTYFSIEIDEEGGITLFRPPDGSNLNEETPEVVDLSTRRVTIRTTEIAHE